MKHQDSKQSKKLIGRAEDISFVKLGKISIPARIDTGAKTSAVWASDIKELDDGLHFKFFGTGSPFYTGEDYIVHGFSKRIIASSIGEPEERYVIRLVIKLAGKRIRGSFTLADRSKQAYPVLVGRNILRGKFIVDVQTGHAKLKLEAARSKQLRKVGEQ